MASSDRELKIIQSTTIQVPVCYKHLHLIREKVIDQASQAGLSETHCAQLEMAVDEACTNIIEHSYGGEIVPEADTPGLRVNFVQYLDRIVIEIYDHGAGFDFQRHRIVEPEQYLANRQERGLGMYIITNFVDDVDYQRGTTAGNYLRLTKLLK